MRPGRVICAIGVHEWDLAATDDGEPERRCHRCGKNHSHLRWWMRRAVSGTISKPPRSWPADATGPARSDFKQGF